MTLIQQTPFDILFKNFFDSESRFNVLQEIKSHHPVDIYETNAGLTFEIACTGLSKEDVDISLEHDLLRVIYNKQLERKNGTGEDSGKNDRQYYSKGIARRSFNLGFKIAPRFDLSKSEAEMKNGLLTIVVPFAEESKPKTLRIK